MKPHVKLGLVVGAVGLVVNVAVSAILGLCGPVVALVVGVIAGLLSTAKEPAPTRGEGTKRAAVAAAIAGALTAIGQVVGGLGVLYLVQALELPLIVGRPPSNPAEAVTYWATGLMMAGCFGTFGVMLAVLAGAGAAYLRDPSPQPHELVPPSPPNGGGPGA